MKYSTAYLCAALSLTVSLQAQTTAPQPAPAPATTTAPANTPQTTSTKKPPVPVFKFQEVKTREYATGYTVGVYGGANLFQFDDATITAPGVNTGMSINSKVAGVGGLKFGYEFPASPIDIQSSDPTSFNFIPAIEAEAGYLGQEYNATLDSGGPGGGSTFKTKLDSAVFMLNGLAKFGMGLWRPYFGGGVGFAWVNGSDASINAPGVTIQDGNDNDVVLACQAIIGMEFFVSDTWSLFGEYKFFYMNDLNLKYTTTTAQNMNFEEAGLGANIVTMGVRTRF